MIRIMICFDIKKYIYIYIIIQFFQEYQNIRVNYARGKKV